MILRLVLGDYGEANQEEQTRKIQGFKEVKEKIHTIRERPNLMMLNFSNQN